MQPVRRFPDASIVKQGEGNVTTIILPHRDVFKEPLIVKYPHCPSFDADGWLIREAGDFSRILFYVEGAQEFAPVHRNLVVRLRRGDADFSLLRSAAEFLPKLKGRLFLPDHLFH